MVSSASAEASPGGSVEYRYMFEDNKSPTKQLDALLRAIARHIVRHRESTPPGCASSGSCWKLLDNIANS